MRRKLKFIIPEEYDNKKLMSFLRGELKFSSRLVIQLKNLPDGLILNEKHIRTIDKVRKNDALEINFPQEESHIDAIEYELDIVFEDEDILIINKPAGLAMHPTHNHQGDTLANAVTSYLLKKGKNTLFRSVGRLDKGTSGLVAVALNSYCASRLQERLEKTYLALAGGKFIAEGTIDTDIIRPDPMKTLRWVGENGERAITHWRALKSNDYCSYLEVKLETGRTHQIRVHFASLGTPLLGDDMYKGDCTYISRPALHCATLSFQHPLTKKTLSFSAKPPKDMEEIIEGQFDF